MKHISIDNLVHGQPVFQQLIEIVYATDTIAIRLEKLARYRLIVLTAASTGVIHGPVTPLPSPSSTGREYFRIDMKFDPVRHLHHERTGETMLTVWTVWLMVGAAWAGAPGVVGGGSAERPEVSLPVAVSPGAEAAVPSTTARAVTVALRQAGVMCAFEVLMAEGETVQVDLARQCGATERALAAKGSTPMLLVATAGQVSQARLLELDGVLSWYSVGELDEMARAGTHPNESYEEVTP